MRFTDFVSKIVTEADLVKTNALKSSDIVSGSSNTEVKEDMIGVADSPGFIPVNPESPGQIMQTPDALPADMDIFALAGPGKKSKGKSKKKEAAVTPGGKVSNFSDFLKSRSK
jgi:hypothetical protein